jgi:hypothetical protein
LLGILQRENAEQRTTKQPARKPSQTITRRNRLCLIRTSTHHSRLPTCKRSNDAFAAVLQKLPFLVNLTADERKSTLKTGPDRVSFVRNANTAAQAHPEIFPASFSKEGFKKDVDLFEVLTELSTRAASVLSQIDDTRMAVGGEAMQEAIQVYNYVTEAAKTLPGLKPVADQLGEQFKKAGKPKEPAKPNP